MSMTNSGVAKLTPAENGYWRICNRIFTIKRKGYSTQFDKGYLLRMFILSYKSINKSIKRYKKGHWSIRNAIEIFIKRLHLNYYHCDLFSTSISSWMPIINSILAEATEEFTTLTYKFAKINFRTIFLRMALKFGQQASILIH